MAGVIEGRTRTFTAGAAIEAHRCLKLSSGDVQHAGATDEVIAFSDRKVASGDAISCILGNAEGTVKLEAADAITAGAVVYCKADGKIDDQADSSKKVGKAITAAAAAGDLIEVMPLVEM